MVETKDFLRVKITFGIYQKYIFLPLSISINHKSLTYSINHLKWVRIKNFFNNSYALNKPYRGPLFQKRINHTHLIRKKQRTFFPKKNKPYVWLIRHRRVNLLLYYVTSSSFVMRTLVLYWFHLPLHFLRNYTFFYNFVKSAIGRWTQY